VTDERRGSPRITAYYAGELETAEGKHGIAITRDISAGGLLVLSRRLHAVGDTVSLSVICDGETIPLKGKVVRLNDLEPGESDLYRCKVALAMDEQDPGLVKLYKKLAP
jgi:hypothetical protein